MGSTLLSIEALQRDLTNAEGELAKASANRARASQLESQWMTEVASLRNLIQVRQERMNPADPTKDSPAASSHEERQTASLDSSKDGSLSLAASEGADINRVNWMAGLIAASGTLGITPPEILKAAERDGIKLHRNYPYIVLRKLVDKDRAVKRRGRYYKKES